MEKKNYFAQYGWMLKIKNRQPVVGFVVHNFTVQKGDKKIQYPQAANKEFAFCPAIHFKYFLHKETFKKVPNYIIFYDESEVESFMVSDFLQN